MRIPFSSIWSSVTGRLYLVIGVLLAALIGTNLQATVYSLGVDASTHRLATTSLEAVRAADEYDELLDKHHRVLNTAIVKGEPALAESVEQFDSIEHEFRNLFEEFTQADGTGPALPPKLMGRLDELKALSRAAVGSSDGTLTEKNTDTVRESALQEYRTVVHAAEDDVAAWKEEMRALTAGELKTLSHRAALNELLSGVTTMAAVAVGVVALTIARELLRKLNKLTRSMLSLASGNLQAGIPYLDRKDEIGTLASALETFRANAVRLRQSEANLTAAFENMNAAIVVCSPHWELALHNQKAATMLGLPDVGSGPIQKVDVLHSLSAQQGWLPAQMGELATKLRNVLHSRITEHAEISLDDGRSFAVDATILPDGNLLTCFHDVTDRQASAARIYHLAHHDGLTELPNRVLFQERLSAAVEDAINDSGLAVTLLMCDLDRFKEVNDTYGHPAGDELLRQVAERMRSTMRKTDVLARLGGDEFAIIHLTGSDSQDTSGLAERILTAIGGAFDLQGNSVSIGVSIGIAQAPVDASTIIDLMKHADLALYAAKREGRHRYAIYTPEMAEQLQERCAIGIELRKALDAQALEVHYQPQVNLQTRAIIGFEALARWNHPARGPIPPSIFIPIAEETGLIVMLGAWIMRQACQDAACWGGNFTMSVNVAPQQLREEDFVDLVERILRESGLPAHRLELEVTESAMLNDGPKMLSVLNALRQSGIRLALDDFGTGYSALSYLQKFPFDKIKIDQSFVRELGKQADSEAIIRAVTGLGASLDISTIAEGIESEAQAELVLSSDCQEGQGYLFSRPIPASEVPGLLGRVEPQQLNLSGSAAA